MVVITCYWITSHVRSDALDGKRLVLPDIATQTLRRSDADPFSTYLHA